MARGQGHFMVIGVGKRLEALVRMVIESPGRAVANSEPSTQELEVQTNFW